MAAEVFQEDKKVGTLYILNSVVKFIENYYKGWKWEIFVCRKKKNYIRDALGILICLIFSFSFLRVFIIKKNNFDLYKIF